MREIQRGKFTFTRHVSQPPKDLEEFNEAYQRAQSRARLRGYDDIVVKNNIAMIQMAKMAVPTGDQTLAPVLKRRPSK
ncbi:hypothetical protein O9929_16975 [Vibrio lentus]|nr:hypothetical protein [Vibrio lentus]